MLAAALRQPGLRILTADDPEHGLSLIHDHRPQIVLTDLVMPKLDGLQVLDRALEFDPTIDVVLMTAHYSTDSAVDAIRRGACDYLAKPLQPSVVRERIGKLVTEARKRMRAGDLERELLESCQFEGIVGQSAAMAEVFARVRRIAPHFRSVLITGETGTGKDLVARAIHNLSPAAGREHVVLNCSAVVETLFESELFGHVRGAFTGATTDKMGLFEHANHGTIFLDEIGDMPLATQAKLLRVLQNQEVQRVGSLTAKRVDVRVIAATNHDLRKAVSDRQFREDLFYRLTMVEIHLPSLRERKEDLPPSGDTQNRPMRDI
jgi:DNA-binding NtrC family response regulator